MTLDAMHWVWNHSQSKGNARIALLYVADQVRDSACEVRLSYPSFLSALNTPSRGTVKSALEAAEKSGELEIAEPASGRRPPLYRLPKAVGYLRPIRASGPESGPQSQEHQPRSGPDFGTQGIPSGPESGPQTDDLETRSGPESGPQNGRSGPEIDPLHPSTPREHAEGAGSEQQRDDYGIPRNVRPLIDAMTRAGLGYIRWPFEGNQWFVIEALIKKSGIEAMTAFAVKAASRTSVESAKFFLPGWRQLAPLPPGYTPPSRNSPPPQAGPHCGDIDCHPDTRLREVEDDDGLPVLIPCAICHPATQGARK